MCSATDKLKRKEGQATVEAAFAIPILMVLILLLLQPGIVLYDKTVMNNAAWEGCRLLTTTAAENDATNEDYIRRRLSSIPEADIFHVHSTGCTWEIERDGDDSTSEVSVTIRTEVKPLPLVDIGLHACGAVNENGNIELEVVARSSTQPDWAQASLEGTPRSVLRDSA